MDLQRQLPCGRQNQGADGLLLLPVFGTLHQVLYDWQGKCRCLPGSCLGAAQKILAIQYIWDCLLLDRGWFGISFLIQGF